MGHDGDLLIMNIDKIRGGDQAREDREGTKFL